MRARVLVDGKVAGFTIRDRKTGLYDAEVNGRRIRLSYRSAGAAASWVKREFKRTQGK